MSPNVELLACCESVRFERAPFCTLLCRVVHIHVSLLTHSLSQLNPPFRRNKMSNRRKYVDLNSKVVLGENNTDEEVLPFGLPKGLPVDSMAEPGVTLSCVLCHEDKTLPSCCFTAPYPLRSIRASLSFFRL